MSFFYFKKNVASVGRNELMKKHLERERVTSLKKKSGLGIGVNVR